jgi:hypothetical protein
MMKLLLLLCTLLAMINAQANLQLFQEALGGVKPPTVTQAGNKFQVEGNSLINTLPSALDRSCAVQHNKCANAANAGGNKNGLTVGACDAQQGRCNAFKQGQAANDADAPSQTTRSRRPACTAGVTAATVAANPAAAAGGAGNLQKFTEALGGVSAPSVTQVGNRFQVQNNDLLNELESALGRSCAVQHNKCANAANAGGNKNGLTVGACDQQQERCEQFNNAV